MPEQSRRIAALFLRLLHVLLIYSGALLVGLFVHWARFPMPWMIGAIIFASSVRMFEKSLPTPNITRQIGQIVIATSVGLSFTPDAVMEMKSLFFPMVGVAVATILLGFVVAVFLMRLTKVDVITAVLASVPMGPVESAILATKYKVQRGPVVFSQSLRIILLVILMPSAIGAFGASGLSRLEVVNPSEWTFSGAMLLCLTGIVGALAARFFSLNNPFFIGSLGGAAVAASFSLPIGSYPYSLLVLAQVFLGVWLGAIFDRELFRHAQGFILGAVLASILLILLCAGMGVVLSWITGQKWQVMLLATAPGSVTEMALTAKILDEGIALVTAFHVIRIFMILPFAGSIIALTARLANKWGF